MLLEKIEKSISWTDGLLVFGDLFLFYRRYIRFKFCGINLNTALDDAFFFFSCSFQ